MNKCFALLVLFIAGCGGSSDNPSNTPAVIEVAVSQTSYQAANRQLTLTATANSASAYCFKTGSQAPSASDSCFQTSSEKVIELTGSLSAYHLWVKNASGTVSATSQTGPCSAEGFAASDKSQLPTVCIRTSLGEMVLELEAEKVPNTVTNFLKYVNAGFYSGTVFHRLGSNFVQGGGGRVVNGQLKQKDPLYDPIVLEKPSSTGVYNTIYSISMARTYDQNSATSGFFINLDNNFSWNSDANPYAAFGRVISGFSVALAISKLTGTTGSDGTITPDQPAVVLWAVQLK
jgi:cyclophilin family peptidyl-prolyl cis-trans isomerase/putative hemolysin